MLSLFFLFPVSNSSSSTDIESSNNSNIINSEDFLSSSAAAMAFARQMVRSFLLSTQIMVKNCLSKPSCVNLPLLRTEAEAEGRERRENERGERREKMRERGERRREERGERRERGVRSFEYSLPRVLDYFGFSSFSPFTFSLLFRLSLSLSLPPPSISLLRSNSKSTPLAIKRHSSFIGVSAAVALSCLLLIRLIRISPAFVAFGDFYSSFSLFSLSSLLNRNQMRKSSNDEREREK